MVGAMTTTETTFTPGQPVHWMQMDWERTVPKRRDAFYVRRGVSGHLVRLADSGKRIFVAYDALVAS